MVLFIIIIIYKTREYEKIYFELVHVIYWTYDADFFYHNIDKYLSE